MAEKVSALIGPVWVARVWRGVAGRVGCMVPLVTARHSCVDDVRVDELDAGAS